ncbi:MAG: D-amino-acid transaminase [Bacteroidales bacterium]|jgi:D-alanine transaminase|nr:D-amino-acid transaminase [Bacteroidales bacterium]
MSTAYFNGKFLPKEEVKISPDDRGFLFADGIYEVVRWYEGFFYDMPGHIARLKRSLNEIRLSWPESESFPAVAFELITRNNLQNIPSLVYLQVTRGAAKRSHAFPGPDVLPTVYAFARGFHPEKEAIAAGINVIIRKEIRWSRCDIKSVSLLPNILSFQEARDLDCYECIFVRDGMITECAHSNVFFVINGVLYTHPESENILSGITRKNIIRIARETGIRVIETPVAENKLNEISEAFITNTSFEIAPVISINKITTGDGHPGPLTRAIRDRFDEEIRSMGG